MYLAFYSGDTVVYTHHFKDDEKYCLPTLVNHISLSLFTVVTDVCIYDENEKLIQRLEF